MTVKERILALKLVEITEQRPEYAKKIGIQAAIRKSSQERLAEEKNV